MGYKEFFKQKLLGDFDEDTETEGVKEEKDESPEEEQEEKVIEFDQYKKIN
jgi:hypothetical protein